MENKHNLLENFEPLLKQVNSLEQMDILVSQVCREVEKVYSCISCRSGCNTCCTGVGLPIAYAREWKRIRNYIAGFSEEKKQLIKESLDSYIKNYGDILYFLHKNIGQPIKESEFKIIFTIVRNEACPLLIDGKCSVYHVRPTACRTFGYFFSVDNNNLLPLTCKSDSLKLKEFFETRDMVHPKLPLEKSVREQLETFIADHSENFEKTIIPVWLLNDAGEYSEKEFRDFESLEALLAEKAKAYVADSKYEPAEEILLMLTDINKKGEYLYYLGFIKFREEKFKAALELFSSALKEGFKTPEMLNLMGLCLEEAGDNKTAEIFFRMAGK